MSTLNSEELYSENYYDYGQLNHTRITNETLRDSPLKEYFQNRTWAILFRGITTILLRIGFLLIQVGSVPVTNVNLILLQNIVDLCATSFFYILVGYVISFNGDIGGLIGRGYWIGDVDVDKEEAVIGWQAVLTASSISTCGIVGRTHVLAYLVISILQASLVHPMLIHWAWTSKGWMVNGHLNGRDLSFKDHSGAGVIHLVGGLSGLIGCLVLGRRILRLRDLDEASVSTGGSGTTFSGHLLVLLGLQGLALPNPSYDLSRITDKHLAHVFVNNVLAASSCSLLVVCLHFVVGRDVFNYWTLMRCLQGAICGVVSIAGGVDVFSPFVCIGMSCLSGVVFYLVSREVFKSALEDYCNIVATYLTSSLLGVVLVPLCRTLSMGYTEYYSMLLGFAWHLICVVALIGTPMLLITPVFLLLELCGILRNRPEVQHHLRAIVALERGPPRSYMQRLFLPDEGSLYLQPGSVLAPGLDSNPESRLLRYENALKKAEENKLLEMAGASEENRTREQVLPENSPEVPAKARIKKLRQIHTIRSKSPVGLEDSGGSGESFREDFFSGPAEITSGIILKEDADLDGMRKRDGALELSKSGSVDIRKEKESRYRLHRTPKSMNLRFMDELGDGEGRDDAANFKFLVEPRRDFSSSLSGEENFEEEVNEERGISELSVMV
ncbi:ammonium transporter 1 member 3-like [Orussus abietinus]|uniref:ammonium transporter 1 member 3-like n=1 Tax=Orussus abietinus TaxID=222816 RepID=UPI000625F16C|nr:ammonium transporter 1 member 3-like [Orussus abietinus]